LQSLSPSVVVMNNGPQKGGEADTFAAIKSAKSVRATYQLHQSFKVLAELNSPADHVANDGNRVGAEAAKCPGNVIKMSVASDGKSYTISIPSNGHSQTYQTKGM
jgi:hypothetical protein